MKKPTALLLCGYRACDPDETAPGLPFIDDRIKVLKGFGYHVICVLSGAQADEQLSHCRRIADCELVFDTNDVPTLATNTKAGLAATNGEGCFVFPCEVPVPEKAHWDGLREQWRRIGFQTKYSVLQLADAEGAPCHYGFPLIVTREGNGMIRDIPGFTQLDDTRLEYFLVKSPEDQTDLAPEAISL